jgi:hypothetical protein
MQPESGFDNRLLRSEFWHYHTVFGTQCIGCPTQMDGIAFFAFQMYVMMSTHHTASALCVQLLRSPRHHGDGLLPATRSSTATTMC